MQLNKMPTEITTPYIFIVRRGETIDSEHEFERQLEDGTWEVVPMSGKVVTFYLKNAKVVNGNLEDFVLRSDEGETDLGSKVEIIEAGAKWHLLITDEETLEMETIENIRGGFSATSAGETDFVDSFKARIIEIYD
jgi:hypothetical protein